MGLGTCRLNANVVNDDAAGTSSSRAATGPQRHRESCTIRSGRAPRRSARTAGSTRTAVRASCSITVTGVGGPESGTSSPE